MAFWKCKKCGTWSHEKVPSCNCGGKRPKEVKQPELPESPNKQKKARKPRI